jgi:hypothetical protein
MYWTGTAAPVAVTTEGEIVAFPCATQDDEKAMLTGAPTAAPVTTRFKAARPYSDSWKPEARGSKAAVTAVELIENPLVLVTAAPATFAVATTSSAPALPGALGLSITVARPSLPVSAVGKLVCARLPLTEKPITLPAIPLPDASRKVAVTVAGAPELIDVLLRASDKVGGNACAAPSDPSPPNSDTPALEPPLPPPQACRSAKARTKVHSLSA